MKNESLEMFAACVRLHTFNVSGRTRCLNANREARREKRRIVCCSSQTRDSAGIPDEHYSGVGSITKTTRRAYCLRHCRLCFHGTCRLFCGNRCAACRCDPGDCCRRYHIRARWICIFGDCRSHPLSLAAARRSGAVASCVQHHHATVQHGHALERHAMACLNSLCLWRLARHSPWSDAGEANQRRCVRRGFWRVSHRLLHIHVFSSGLLHPAKRAGPRTVRWIRRRRHRRRHRFSGSAIGDLVQCARAYKAGTARTGSALYPADADCGDHLFFQSGLLASATWVTYQWCLPAVLAGTFLGLFLFDKID